MDEFTSAIGISTAVFAAIIGDLLLRGVWRFIDMSPAEKAQNTRELKTAFMISLPISYISLMALFAWGNSLGGFSFILVFLSALGFLLSVSMFFDAIKYIRKLEHKINQLASEQPHKDSDKKVAIHEKAS